MVIIEIMGNGEHSGGDEELRAIAMAGGDYYRMALITSLCRCRVVLHRH